MTRPTVTIRLFSVLRERAGSDRLELAAGGFRTVGDAAEALYERFPALAPYRSVVRLARNQVYVDPAEPLRPGDEIALITPTSGG
jgi:molybdopterin converting factor small subunit